VHYVGILTELYISPRLKLQPYGGREMCILLVLGCIKWTIETYDPIAWCVMSVCNVSKSCLRLKIVVFDRCPSLLRIFDAAFSKFHHLLLFILSICGCRGLSQLHR